MNSQIGRQTNRKEINNNNYNGQIDRQINKQKKINNRYIKNGETINTILDRQKKRQKYICKLKGKNRQKAGKYRERE